MKLTKIAALIAAVAMAGQVQAASVRIFGENPFGGNVITHIDSFYDSVTSGNSQVISTLDSASVSGAGLLWLSQPSNPYTATQLSVLTGFLSAGGRIAFLGEHGFIAPTQNNNINLALSALGAHIQIQNLAPDAGFRTATVADGQIKAHALTAGVNSYEYACFAPLLLSGAAQTLMTGEEDPNQVMMAYENIGSGSIFLITDQNVWDNQPSNWPGFNNSRMFENLLLGDTGAPPVNGVPEPTTALLASLGLLGLAGLRRRKQV
jgi:hypothetical protein